jgi:hypothetical protein
MVRSYPRRSLWTGPSTLEATIAYAAIYDGNFYDDLVVGVSRMLSIGAVLSSPVIDHGNLYFGSADGNVYALQ